MESIEELQSYDDSENIIIGKPAEWKNSSITISGINNYLVFDGDVLLYDSKIELKGNNSLVYICSSKTSRTRINVTIFSNSVFFLGRTSATTKTIRAILSEGKHIFIGARCLLSFGIWLRNSDAHLIYDGETNDRISKSKSIYIGDHVWIGQEAFIGKGTQIGSGSIVGARSLITGKKIPSNSLVAGTPAKIIKENVFWDRPNVHSFTEEQSNEVEHFVDDKYKYENDRHTHKFDNIEKTLNSLETAKVRYEYIKENFADKYRKNRFFVPAIKQKQRTKKQKIIDKIIKFLRAI